VSTASTASVAFLDAGTAVADSEPTLAEVRERVNALHREAEAATERYNAATEAARTARAELARLRDSAARRAARLNDARRALGAHASAEYRAGGLPASVQLALSTDPDEFLRRAAVADRDGDHQARAVLAVRDQLRDVERLRAEAAERTEALAGARAAAREHRATVRARLAEAQELLATLTAEQRERALRAPHVPANASAVTRAATATAPSARAAAAVTFAMAQLGKPYAWGATGPDSYDCSGLTQAAWESAGVALPRTSSAQAGAGTPVPRAALAPGDLVFYYSGISHVAMYVGDGQVVHASRPGAPVALAPLDSMPFAAATRPA
jgi:cell wall-associated NlpC family hydrolase